jgi:hypothetical protein
MATKTVFMINGITGTFSAMVVQRAFVYTAPTAEAAHALFQPIQTVKQMKKNPLMAYLPGAMPLLAHCLVKSDGDLTQFLALRQRCRDQAIFSIFDYSATLKAMFDAFDAKGTLEAVEGLATYANVNVIQLFYTNTEPELNIALEKLEAAKPAPVMKRKAEAMPEEEEKPAKKQRKIRE